MNYCLQAKAQNLTLRIFNEEVSKIKHKLKEALKKFPVAFTKNQQYDLLTRRIIKKHLNSKSNCIDIGMHKGEIFKLFLNNAPEGFHFGFEPIPDLYKQLQKKYEANKNCSLFQIALSNEKKTTPFNYVISNPAYSGIKKRKYDRKNEKDISIEVEADLLDNIVPQNIPIHFIKIDVEGGEMNVLEGGKKLLAAHHPLIVFECGIGASDLYGTTPEKLFSFFAGLNYQILLMNDFIKNKQPLSSADFSDQFYQNKNYYFVAH